ncbi:MAG TPA: S8/S53 family peptidase [Streptosporangiaceae bacterium]
MTMPDGWREDFDSKVASEIEHIISAFRDGPDGGRSVTAVPDGNGGIGHMHAEGQILVSEEHLDRVLELLGQPSRQELEQGPGGRLQRITPGVMLHELAGGTVAEALETLDFQLGRGIATPNHVLTVAGTGYASACPATEPEEVYFDSEPCPTAGSGDRGLGVLVYMADTGLLADAATGHPWLSGVEGRDVDPLPAKLPDGTQQIPPYTGHGTFVAGVLRCVAPGTEITVTNAFATAGSILESDLVQHLDHALGLGVDIFQLNICCTSRHDLPLVAFREWLHKLREYKGTICVAAAGNSGMRRPTWPAAFPGVIAVGALGGDWRGRASFSNYGGWVDVYAPGRDLVNAYATGTYTCHVAPYKDQVRQFYGMAKWSGTSFSTPIVSGLIAARMSQTGENARQAAAAVLAEARAQAIPGVGAVLLPLR